MKRLKWIAPVDQNIDFTGLRAVLRATIREVAAILKSLEQQLMWLQAHLDSRLPIPFTTLNQERAWDRSWCFFFGKPQWQVQWSEEVVFLSLHNFANVWLAKNFGVEKNLSEGRHQLLLLSPHASSGLKRAVRKFIHWEQDTVKTRSLLGGTFQRRNIIHWSCAEINSTRTFISTTEILCAIAWCSHSSR